VRAVQHGNSEDAAGASARARWANQQQRQAEQRRCPRSARGGGRAAAVAGGLGTQRKGRKRAQARQWDATGAAVDAAGAAVRWQASSVPGQW